MLLDEKDLLVLENSECRAYFKEILQCYYSQNYRGTIVLLYSFVIYDLYMKLQTMAKEGNPAAETKLTEVKAMIADDEKYSKVEKTVVQFLKTIVLYILINSAKILIILRTVGINVHI